MAVLGKRLDNNYFLVRMWESRSNCSRNLRSGGTDSDSYNSKQNGNREKYHGPNQPSGDDNFHPHASQQAFIPRALCIHARCLQ